MAVFCSPFFNTYSRRGGKSNNLTCAPSEKSSVATVATLLAHNVYHVWGSVAIPQKCRIIQTGEYGNIQAFKKISFIFSSVAKNGMS